mmetsp:Transcript_40416/g.38905  ORF Transcript_40416/g.38905 Transcript_40416/m.38905 type:complete len:284 (-) Transcript_40416:64-915(-)
MDVTSVRDEMGYNLVHLTAYNNTEKCMKVLFQHILGSALNASTKSPHDDFEIIHAINRRQILKEWINQPTQVLQGQADSQSNNTDPMNFQPVDISESCGFTALHFASYHGNHAMLQMLVEAGANAYATNKQDINMLHVGAQGNSPYSIAYFSQKMGISVNSQDRELSTPLHWACISKSHTVVGFLLAWGAEVNAQDLTGLTPLHLCIRDIDQQQNYSTLKKLMFYGANPNIHDYMGRKPLDLLPKNVPYKVEEYVLKLLKPGSERQKDTSCFGKKKRKPLKEI